MICEFWERGSCHWSFVLGPLSFVTGSDELQRTRDKGQGTKDQPMQLALVLGSAVSTVKHPTLSGCKLLVAQPLAADGRSPDGEPQLVVDVLGAGRGETIVITNDGKASRELLKSENTPVRWTTLGIQNP